jgi:hypothetical protein
VRILAVKKNVAKARMLPNLFAINMLRRVYELESQTSGHADISAQTACKSALTARFARVDGDYSVQSI